MPNEPPTLPVRMRTCFGSTLRISAMLPFMPNAPCDGTCSVNRPVAGSYTPIAARGSIGVHHQAGVDELELRDMRGLGEGGGDLFAVAIVIVERDIAGGLGIDLRRACRAPHPRRAPPPAARSISTSTASAASFACSGVSATTNATGSPTKRTLSVGSAGRGGLRMSVPSRFLNAHGALERAVVGKVGAGIDAEHARHLSGRGRCRCFLMTPCATRLRTITA